MYASLFWWWWCPLPCLPDWYSLLSYLFKYVPDLHFCSAEDLLRFFVPQKDNLLRFLLQEAQSSQIFVAQKDNLLRFLLQRSTIFSDRPPSYLFFSSVPSSTLLQCIGVDVWKNPVPIGFKKGWWNSGLRGKKSLCIFFSCYTIQLFCLMLTIVCSSVSFFLHLVGVSSAANSSPGQKISCHWCQVSSNKSKFWPDLFLLEYNFLPRRHPPPILVEIKFFVSFSLFPSLQKKM